MNPYHQSSYQAVPERLQCVRCCRVIEAGTRFLNYAVRLDWYPVCEACSTLADEHGLVFDCRVVRQHMYELSHQGRPYR